MTKRPATKTRTRIGFIKNALAETQTPPTLQRIPLNDIRPDKAQIRQGGQLSIDDITNQGAAIIASQAQEQFEAIAALAKTIAKVGLLEPVIVCSAPGGGYDLIAGERRWLASHYAAQHLNYSDKIEARVYPNKPDQKTINDIQFIENYHRENLTMVEIIEWTLRRFNDFEIETNGPIGNADIQKIMSIKNTMARYYLNTYNADRARVDTLLERAKAGAITTLKEFAHLATHPDEPLLPTPNQDEQNQIEEAAQRDTTEGEGRAAFKVGLRFANPHVIEAFIKKYTTAKQYQKYANVDWESGRDAGAALRKFFADWESKH